MQAHARRHQRAGSCKHPCCCIHVAVFRAKQQDKVTLKSSLKQVRQGNAPAQAIGGAGVVWLGGQEQGLMLGTYANDNKDVTLKSTSSLDLIHCMVLWSNVLKEEAGHASKQPG
eukprot:1159689-Pelagomonas_calceolata.AAC.1